MANFKTYYSFGVSARRVRLERDFYPDIFSIIKNAQCLLSITLLIQAMSDLLFKSVPDLLPCHVALEKCYC